MRKALYREYRPKTLSEVIGESQVTDTLKKSLESGNFSHAYLFIGPRGCGKTSVARILAHEINNFEYNLEDDYVDIIEIDAASNTGVDNIRELREKALIAPTKGKFKVYIIDEVHMLSKSAFNALLKTLEEPPEHVIFIMATTDAYKVPVTITSRAQVYTFKLADESVMLPHLKNICEKEGIKISEPALRIVAKRGGGSFRDTLSLLDQISTLASDTEITEETVIKALGLPSELKIANLLQDAASGDVVKITTSLKDILAEGIKPETLAEELIVAITTNPTRETLPLLAKLPEVKAPFPEAKLLVALSGCVAGTIGNFVHYKKSEPEAPSSTAPEIDTRLRPRSISGEPVVKATLREDSSEQNSSIVPAPALTTSNFSWEGLISAIESQNDAVSSQLKKVDYTFDDQNLHLYPKRNIVKTILERNKPLIVTTSGKKVTIHNIDEPKDANSAQNSSPLSKLSAIMGGNIEEVKIDNVGGEDIF